MIYPQCILGVLSIKACKTFACTGWPPLQEHLAAVVGHVRCHQGNVPQPRPMRMSASLETLSNRFVRFSSLSVDRPHEVQGYKSVI